MSTPNKPEAIIRGETESKEKVDFALLTALVRCLKLAAMHQLDNRAIAPSIQQLMLCVNPEIQRGNKLSLQVSDDNVFFNRQIIKLAGDTYESAMALKDIYGKLGISEVGFTVPLGEQDIKDFLGAFQRFSQSASPAAFATQRFPKILVRPATGGGSSAEDLRRTDPRRYLVRCYAAITVVFRQAAQTVQQGRPVKLDRLRRAMQQFVDAAVDQEALLLALARFDNAPGDGAVHASAVTAYTLALGRRLELPRTALMDLCLASLFHDLGRVPFARIPVTEANLEQYRSAMARVPMNTVLGLGRGIMAEDTVQRMAVAMEHGLPVDGSAGGLVPEAPARIIAVPCMFHALTCPPAPRRGLLADQALRVIQARAGTRFDPIVVRQFALMLGRYPPGSLVRLAGGQYGVVVAPPSSAQALDRPVVKLLPAPGKTGLLVDLGDGRNTLRIACAVDPRDHNVNVIHHVLA